MFKTEDFSKDISWDMKEGKMRIGINGFGRIGRQVFRIAFERDDVEVVHINDLTDAKTLAHLLEFDTVHSRFPYRVLSDDGSLEVDGRPFPVTARKDPAALPWAEKEVDVVLESTGAFRRREDAQKHLLAGARKVLVSAPGKDALDGDFVIGVNDEKYDPEKHDIISIGSCTTNCLAPLARVIHESFEIRYGLINTIHAYTSSQNLLDGPHKDLRRARTAAGNIIPTTTGAAKPIGLIMPELEGRLDGLAIRVPVACGSILDLTCMVEKETTAEKINDLMREQAMGPWKGILAVQDAPVVSSDIIGSPYSSILSPEDTYVTGGHLVKVLAWYDNEWGFSCRCVDMMSRMA